MFTELVKQTWFEAMEMGLNAYYNEYIGNFGFTENELFRNMNKILMWLESHSDYALIYQYCEDYEGRYWWLTPRDTL